MTRDASLDEFAGGGKGDDAEDAEDANDSPGDAVPVEDAAETTDAPTTGDDATFLPPDQVEPARSTYDWSPGGAACAACGATVEARWRDEPGLVCADCKAW
ncbi:DUF7573 domain-containing protein [Haloglomus litoreum]|uniref:DUF7573 domain-containing protein n=1 Tax=Haloglomus litoreum TaxID=3034026 RepID=UPI0023E790CE|nr:hypothetical protein [Haloglomus sp. DT116]